MVKFNRVKIGVFDSGIGGISTLIKIVKTNPQRTIYYLGDNANVPYGEKSKSELLILAAKGVNKLVSLGANVIVIGCNTLSLNVLPHLKRIFCGVQFFGVFPPLESFLLSNKDFLVLATPRSIKNIKQNYKGINAVALSDLACDIENNFDNLSNVNLKKHLGRIPCNYKNVILGCTHYEFIKKEFSNYFKGANIVSGSDFTVAAVENFVKKQSVDHFLQKSEVIFVGGFADKNYAVFRKFYPKILNF